MESTLRSATGWLWLYLFLCWAMGILTMLFKEMLMNADVAI